MERARLKEDPALKALDRSNYTPKQSLKHMEMKFTAVMNRIAVREMSFSKRSSTTFSEQLIGETSIEQFTASSQLFLDPNALNIFGYISQSLES